MSMNKSDTTLTIKTPKKLRNEAKKVAKEMGIPLGTVMNTMLQDFVNRKEITLSAKRPKKEVKQAIDDLRAGKGEVYSSVDELFAAIDTE